jgi:hypothetical protein
MRVRAYGSPALQTPAAAGQGRAIPTFGLPGAPAAPQVRACAPAAMVAGLLALQNLAGAGTERRRRAIGRGHALLDLLDAVRRGLLEGGVPTTALAQLRAELVHAVEPDQEPALCTLLEAIDVRAAVEIAKLEAVVAVA